ncbi:MAG: hypothetical protein H6622_07565 [Halobacteriovoraceae bacterium]|nr:hypothetical protein [Halobacteriovoraceae bacterium]
MKYIRILVTKFIHQLIPHSILSGCEKHSVNIANFEDLSFLKRAKINVHLWLCYKCYCYAKQLKLIEKTVSEGYRIKSTKIDDKFEKEIIQKYTKN